MLLMFKFDIQKQHSEPFMYNLFPQWPFKHAMDVIPINL